MHVFTEVSPQMQATMDRLMLGVPYCEVFTEPCHRKCLELYEWVRKYREDVAFICTAPNGERGVVTLSPLDHDEIAVFFEPVRGPLRLVPEADAADRSLPRRVG